MFYEISLKDRNISKTFACMCEHFKILDFPTDDCEPFSSVISFQHLALLCCKNRLKLKEINVKLLKRGLVQLSRKILILKSEINTVNKTQMLKMS